MSIKLIASDLDGTLLTESKAITKATYEALSRVKMKGVQFVGATGRAFASVPQEVLALPGTEYVITSNGGAIYSVPRKKRIYQCLLTAEAVEAVLEEKRSAQMAIEVFIDGIPYSDAEYVADPKAYGATDFGVSYVKSTRRPVRDILGFAWKNKACMDSISLVGATDEERKMLQGRLLAHVPDIYVTTSGAHMLEIGNADAGKGKTLLKLLEILDISPEETMALGDADNDIPMLKAVRYGIAMGNATPGCKEAASYITETNGQDGVAKAIARFVG